MDKASMVIVSIEEQGHGFVLSCLHSRKGRRGTCFSATTERTRKCRLCYKDKTIFSREEVDLSQTESKSYLK